MKKALVFILVLICIFAVGCIAETKEEETTSIQTTLAQTTVKESSTVSSGDVFASGSYKCDVKVDDGTMEMKVKGNRVRYDGTIGGVIVRGVVDGEYLYIYMSRTDKWIRMSYDIKTAGEQGFVSEEDVKAMDKTRVSCEETAIDDSEFMVPADKVMDLPKITVGG